MTKYKHQMIEAKNEIGWDTYKCIYCGYENHTMGHTYPYPWFMGVTPVYCRKSPAKIRWWESFFMYINCKAPRPKGVQQNEAQ